MDGSKVNNIIRIPTSLYGNFYRLWLEFLAPFHNLTSREMDIAAAFLKHRQELSEVIKDPDLLEKVVMGEDTKRSIREECKVTVAHFQIIMGKLRKSKIIVDGKINPKFVPKNLSSDSNSFRLLLYFDLDGKRDKKTL